MNFEEAFKVADLAVFAYQGQHLNDLQKIVLEGSWYGLTYEQIAEHRGYSCRYLKQDAGNKLWNLLSKALGEDVKKTNFRTAIERRSQSQLLAEAAILSSVNPEKFKLLLVEDEPENLDLLHRAFRRDFKAFKAESGIKALEILEQEGEMAVIISDQRMPMMKGTEFLSLTVDRFPDTTRILLTGYTDVEDMVEATNSAHVFKYITKPWSPEQMRAVVQEAAQMYLTRKQISQKVAEEQSSQSLQEEEEQKEFAEISSQNSKKFKLLVVDDEPEHLDLLYRIFRLNFQVFKAESGIKALEILEQEGEMAVIISDLRMLPMSGIEFLSLTIDRFPDTMRIILTGYTDVDDLVEAINLAQAFKYVIKPCDLENLKAVVQEATDKYRIQKKRTNAINRLSLLKQVIFRDES